MHIVVVLIQAGLMGIGLATVSITLGNGYYRLEQYVRHGRNQKHHQEEE